MRTETVKRPQWAPDCCRELVGIPYQDCAATPKGASCWGLVCLFWERHGETLPRTWERTAMEIAEAPLSSMFRELAPSERPVFGDVVLIAADGPDHVGIWTPEGVLHSGARGSLIEHHRTVRAVSFHRLRSIG